MNRYIRKSLELHLFFGRIMKEHAFFLQAGFTPAGQSFAKQAESYRKEFENVLRDVVKLSDGAVGEGVLNSGEIVTEFTVTSEEQTECLTGIPINAKITQRTLCLKPADCRCAYTDALRSEVKTINRKVLKLLDGLMALKESILQCVKQGELFTVNYPLLIEHILREARLYRKYVVILERDGDLPEQVVKGNECFWNQIMMEHAQFIRGLLDPSETELFCAADDFAKEYCKLLEAGRNAQNKAVRALSAEQTVKFRDFKAAGTQGIQENKIRSIILPLLADHVLREANHYLRLLQC